MLCRRLFGKNIRYFKISIRSIFLAVCLISLTACESEYDRGYNKGRSEGYSSGYDNGKEYGYRKGKDEWYEKGKDDGYTKGNNYGYVKGYTSGTLNYIEEHGLPSLGLSIIILLIIATTYYSFKYFKGPSKRIIDESIDIIEEARQKNILKNELKRKKLSAQEEAKIRAINLSNIIFCRTIQAMSDDKTIAELNNLKLEAEEKILQIQLDAICKIANEYQESIKCVVMSDNLSANEKTKLFTEINDNVNKMLFVPAEGVENG